MGKYEISNDNRKMIAYELMILNDGQLEFATFYNYVAKTKNHCRYEKNEELHGRR